MNEKSKASTNTFMFNHNPTISIINDRLNTTQPCNWSTLNSELFKVPKYKVKAELYINHIKDRLVFSAQKN